LQRPGHNLVLGPEYFETIFIDHIFVPVLETGSTPQEQEFILEKIGTSTISSRLDSRRMGSMLNLGCEIWELSTRKMNIFL
jgi:hypothetical protein